MSHAYPTVRATSEDRDWVGIVNGFGVTLGDSIIGLQALHAALTLGAFAQARPMLFRLQPERSPLIGELYRSASHVSAIHPQPYWQLAERPPRQIIDIRDFAFDPAFRGVAMIDYFLHHLGLELPCVPGGLKRNTWLKPCVVPKPSPGLPPAYVLVCPQAAMPMRVMPDAVHQFILEQLSELQPLPVLTQAKRSHKHDERVVCVSECMSLAELAGLVVGAALIVSTDTALVHLADAYSVPCLAVFTTHRPEWRVRDYPLCRPVHRPARLPDAIEFARGPEDIEAAQAAWFDAGRPDWLDEVLRRAVAEFIPQR